MVLLAVGSVLPAQMHRHHRGRHRGPAAAAVAAAVPAAVPGAVAVAGAEAEPNAYSAASESQLEPPTMLHENTGRPNQQTPLAVLVWLPAELEYKRCSFTHRFSCNRLNFAVFP